MTTDDVVDFRTILELSAPKRQSEGKGSRVGSRDLAEDVLECDYTLAAKRVVSAMRNLMAGDEEEVDAALRMALTWYEASNARERPVAGPGRPTKNRFGPLTDEPIRGKVLFGPINVQALIRPFALTKFPVATAALKLAEQNLWRIGRCNYCGDLDNRGVMLISFPNGSVFG